MAQAAIRVRGRPARTKGNPFVLWGVVAGLAGVVLLGCAVWFYLNAVGVRDRTEKLARGIRLVNELTPIACDYFYSGKADKKEHLPDEVWAPLAGHRSDPDFCDAMLTLSVGAEDHLLDAAIRKDGKDRNGQPTRFLLGAHFRHPINDKSIPELAKIQIVDGHVSVNGVMRPAVFFRRSILPKDGRTDAELGKATVILLADASAPRPAKPAPAGKPGPSLESPAPAKKL